MYLGLENDSMEATNSERRIIKSKSSQMANDQDGATANSPHRHWVQHPCADSNKNNNTIQMITTQMNPPGKSAAITWMIRS